MRTYNTLTIRDGIIRFCRKVKFGHPVTAKSIGLSSRQTHLLKEVLTHKFSKSLGAPFDFPKLFICDNAHKGLYHKNSTPNDVDLSNLCTVVNITELMTYVSQEKRSKNEKQEDDTRLDFTRPHTMKVLRADRNGDVVVVFHFI